MISDITNIEAILLIDFFGSSRRMQSMDFAWFLYYLFYRIKILTGKAKKQKSELLFSFCTVSSLFLYIYFYSPQSIHSAAKCKKSFLAYVIKTIKIGSTFYFNEYFKIIFLFNFWEYWSLTLQDALIFYRAGNVFLG